MPMNRSLYPSDWEAISQRIRFERAGGKCEQCGAAHGSVVMRLKNGYPRWTRIILTTHHIGVDKEDGTPGDPADKMDCRDENLAALCQRCHLEADKAHHIAARRVTLVNRKHDQADDAGQLDMFESEGA